jgi:hypothetical protein
MARWWQFVDAGFATRRSAAEAIVESIVSGSYVGLYGSFSVSNFKQGCWRLHWRFCNGFDVEKDE